MNVAHVTSTFPPYWGGTGNVAYHNALVLHERGHEVTLFTAQAQTGSATSFSTPFPTHRLSAPFRLGNAPFTPSLLGKLKGFDLIHLHYPYIFGAELALLAASKTRTPLVLTYHNQLGEVQPLKRALFGAYNLTAEPLLLRRAAKLLAVSREHLTSLHPHLDGDARVAELPNGVDTARFRPLEQRQARLELATDPSRPVILFVGALDSAHRFKNVPGLLRAFAKVNTDAQLWLVGDGNLRGELETLAQTLGLAERVRFLGKHVPADLPPIYAAADVTVLPSTGVESFGVVLIESLACATPVIASALPGVRRVVSHERDGLLVPPGDVAALTHALETVLSNPTWAKGLGCAGLDKVRRHYSWTTIGARLETIYEEVLTERGLSWRGAT